MSSPDKCPHCGAESTKFRNIGGFFKCYSFQSAMGFHKTDYCQERSAHAATKRELEAAKVDAASWQQQAEQRLDYANEWGRRSEKAESELAQAKRELEEYRKERQDFIDRDNAMKMAVQDDAERLRKAEANAAMWHTRYEAQRQAHELSELAAKKAESRVRELEAAIELARVGH